MEGANINRVELYHIEVFLVYLAGDKASIMAEDSNGSGKPLLDITFMSLRDKNIEQLKVLNRVIFPIRYQVS